VLDFETCKRLKEAGFPQTNVYIFYNTDGRMLYIEESQWHDEYFVCPTIEDLLKELGENFDSLDRSGDRCWFAQGGGYADACTFENAEQALAHLYLSLLAHD